MKSATCMIKMHLSSRGGDCTGNKEQKGSRESLKHSSDEKRCINYTYFLGHVTCGKVSAGSEFQFTNMEFPFMYSMKLIQENNI